MSANGLISVIVPVFNGEKYVQRCITSLLDQTYSNLEIIVIDNGSTDNSLSIIENFKDDRIFLFQENMKGVSYARNTGLKKARGEFVSFIDCDDWVEKNYFEILMANIGENDIIGCDFYIEYESEKIKRRDFSKDKNEFCVKNVKNVIQLLEAQTMYTSVIWGKLYRRNIILKHSFKKLSYGEDSEFMMRVLLNSEFAKYICYKGYHYFLNDGSVTVKTKGRELEKKYGAMYLVYSMNVELWNKGYKSQVISERLLYVALDYIKSAIKRGSLGNKRSRELLLDIRKHVDMAKITTCRKFILLVWPFIFISKLEKKE